MRKILCLIMFCLNAHFIYSDMREIDSLYLLLKTQPEDTNKVNLLFRISNEYDSISNNKKMFEVADSALILSEKLGYKPAIANAHFLKGLASLQSSDVLESYYDFQTSLKLYTDLNDLNNMAKVYGHIGVFYTYQGKYPEALKYMLEGIRIREKIGNENTLPKAYINIGSLYRIIGDYSRSREYLFKAIRIHEKNNSKSGIAKAYTSIGNTYREEGDYENAIKYHRESLALNSKLNNKDGIIKTEHNLGEIYLLKGIDLKKTNPSSDSLAINFKLAEEYMTSSLKSAQVSGERTSQAANYIDLGLLYLEQNKAGKAKEYLTSGLAVLKHINNREYLKENYHRLAMADSALGNFKSAFENYKLFTLYNDSLFNEENTKKITQQQMQFDFNSKEQIAKAEQDRKDAIINEKLQRQKLLIILITVVSLMIFVAGLLLYSRNKIKRKADHQAAELKRMNEIESIRGRISRDLHDDIGSTLSSINILSRLEEKEKLNNGSVLSKIGERSAKVMQAMDDIVWAVNPENDTLDKIAVRMREYAAEMFEAKNINYKFQISEKLSDLKLNMEQRRDLFLIYKESVNNLAKYSECTSAEVNLLLKENSILMEIKDNGKGFDASSLKTSGNGLANLQNRAGNLKAELTLNSHKDTGTTVTLKVPITL